MPIEETIAEWLTKDENLEYVIEESVLRSRQCLVVTSQRAILFNVSFFKRLKDVSDKHWRQLIDVHLEERLTRASLTVSFFQHHPVDSHDSHEGDENYLPVNWKLSPLPRKSAREVYRILKEKEHTWKEIRRLEHLEHDRAMSALRFQFSEPNNTT